MSVWAQRNVSTNNIYCYGGWSNNKRIEEQRNFKWDYFATILWRNVSVNVFTDFRFGFNIEQFPACINRANKIISSAQGPGDREDNMGSICFTSELL